MTNFDLQKESSLPLGETEILMAFLLGKEKEFILTHPEFVISLNVYKKFKELEKKRLAGWSIAVLIGHKEFYGLDFYVDKNVLVPRPETEMMVEEILHITKEKPNNLMLIDLGTGSGAIIISLAGEIKRIFPTQYQKIIFRAVDISASALNIAKKNAILNKQNKKIKFLSGNLLEPLINKDNFNNLLNRELIIAANLPYLTPAQVNISPSIKKEPRVALVAGSDGLKYYRELFKQIIEIKKNFNPNININQPITILCEIDPSQAKPIKLLVEKYFPLSKMEIKKDLANRNRLAIIKIPD
jgi:release factor glutamine methyltransferase